MLEKRGEVSFKRAGLQAGAAVRHRAVPPEAGAHNNREQKVNRQRRALAQTLFDLVARNQNALVFSCSAPKPVIAWCVALRSPWRCLRHSCCSISASNWGMQAPACSMLTRRVHAFAFAICLNRHVDFAEKLQARAVFLRNPYKAAYTLRNSISVPRYLSFRLPRVAPTWPKTADLAGGKPMLADSGPIWANIGRFRGNFG